MDTCKWVNEYSEEIKRSQRRRKSIRWPVFTVFSLKQTVWLDLARRCQGAGPRWCQRAGPTPSPRCGRGHSENFCRETEKVFVEDYRGGALPEPRARVQSPGSQGTIRRRGGSVGPRTLALVPPKKKKNHLLSLRNWFPPLPAIR